jgi:hypothetical protein
MPPKTSLLLGLLLLGFFVTITAPAWAAPIPIYDNGPINGTIGNFDITASDPQVFDSFTVSGGPRALFGLTFGAWLQPGDAFQSISFEIWTGPGRGGTSVFSANSIQITQSNCSTNSMGSAVCLETIFFTGTGGPTLAPGTYWLDLNSAATLKQGSAGWDINNGVGCMSSGCPSQAQDGNGFSQQSESFAILGGLQQTTPEPASLLLFSSGITAAIASVRRKKS